MTSEADRDHESRTEPESTLADPNNTLAASESENDASVQRKASETSPESEEQQATEDSVLAVEQSHDASMENEHQRHDRSEIVSASQDDEDKAHSTGDSKQQQEADSEKLSASNDREDVSNTFDIHKGPDMTSPAVENSAKLNNDAESYLPAIETSSHNDPALENIQHISEQDVQEQASSLSSIASEEQATKATHESNDRSLDENLENAEFPTTDSTEKSVEKEILTTQDSAQKPVDPGSGEPENQIPNQVNTPDATKSAEDHSSEAKPSDSEAETTKDGPQYSDQRPDLQVSFEGTSGVDTEPTPGSAPMRSPMQHSALSASSLSRGSAVFVLSALEIISNSKDAKRSTELKEAATTALEMVRQATNLDASAGHSSVLDPRVVFEPLRLACITKNASLQITSLDCIAKLVSYAFFAEDDSLVSSGRDSELSITPLADIVVETVCECFEDQLDERIGVQIVKALLACVLSTSIRVHQSSLLHAVRTVYNVFLVSRTSATQAIAQGSLSQMISYVFSRVPRKAKTANAMPVEEPEKDGEHVTLQMMENRTSFEGSTERDEMLTGTTSIDAPDLLVKDAFLVLRALCKLSMKSLGAESERDMRSQAMRSKLLSLHMIHNILSTHMDLFTDPSVQILSTTTGDQSSFVQASKQYLCLSLSRNAVSSVIQVFEISCEIFWLMIEGMRTKVKKEIEVLFNEIFLPILEMRSSTTAQKSVLLGVVVHRLCRDPQTLVEIYLNYDCDRSALENVYERLMNIIARLAQAPQSSSSSTSTADPAVEARNSTPLQRMPTNSSNGSRSSDAFERSGMPLDARLKRQSLDCLCSVLGSMVIWLNRHVDAEEKAVTTTHSEQMIASAADEEISGTQDDDPGRFENAKARKNTLLEAIRTFNYKPKRGIERLIDHGFIRDRRPQSIARFLFFADGLSKTNIGEYLGEGDAENIAVMHAFVDLMNFDQMPFTTALRRFLQAFRLPGEAQKIDRYMLKFAERYVAGNKGAFANADTAYVLAYSVIMLNTDAHNPQVKQRMTLQDFIKNNAGIDDGGNLPDDFLRSIYDEIQRNEIKMKDEAPETPAVPQGGLATAIAAVGRDLQHEAYVRQSEGMASRTEVLFRTMLMAQRRAGNQKRALVDQFFSASHIEHVKPMFEVAWMSFLAGISSPLQDSMDPDVIHEVLQGFRDAIKIVCFFGLELERNAFVTTLGKFTFLNNFGEMKSKNVETIKVLLDIAHTEGNELRGSWREVLTCVSQLERFQLISLGMDQRTLPNLGRRQASLANGPHAQSALPNEEVIQAGGSTQITVAADQVFSSTPNLSGEAITDFVQCLCDLSWEEIQASGMSDNPRLFSLQKLVEISYYNMSRIRMEWSRLWTILGEHFNQVCCHPNPAVSAFGLDSLRQLAMKFLEKDELSHFKFQKDFLKPFEYAMRRNPDASAKEMVLQCLEQMMQSRADHIRSGWATMLGVYGVAAGAPERVALNAYEIVRRVHAEHLDAILANDSFSDLCVCIAHFGKVGSQKISLPATEMLRTMVPKHRDDSTQPEKEAALHKEITETGPEEQHAVDNTQVDDQWLAVLFALYDILMTGDDLEVRRVALEALFGLLREHGAQFTPTFWDTVCQDVVFPIFNVLRNRSDLTRFSSQEDMSVWLSTTMIQALRNLVELWTFYFDTLKKRLAGLLELLCACICQENDTLARIGTTCLRELVVKNVDRLDEERWQLITDAFLRLFRATTASQVFDPALSSPEPAMGQVARRHAFKQIIVKCVLQLLLIETTNALLQENQVYAAIPALQLLRLTQALEDSYRFSRRFNADRALRTALWRVGFMKQLPNLLKQESTSASTLVHVYLQMQGDAKRLDAHQQVSARLLPLAEEIVSVYLPLDNDTQARNIAAWTPVVAQVVDGLATLYDLPNVDQSTKQQCTSTFYLLLVELLDKTTMAPALVVPLRRYLTVVGLHHNLVDQAAASERRRQREEVRTAAQDGPLRATPSTMHLQAAGEQSNSDLVMRDGVNASVDILPLPVRTPTRSPGQSLSRLGSQEEI
ncbi:guanine nucleotide exchange protein for ADP-robosylation factor [Malassezia yamatoensis]|uniref:Guanine nucleotide exchange protein for ADP-robosylation factor n=1 Tax=Malassezia yamatoensis TaxID=253288 RepID=A0AAJ5YNE3_9BASI|nr:guanine nucleotide exchange protein for ADP-robosylation factor [Malassezia yamatoensis]